MDTARRINLAWRWALLAGLVATVFWTSWYSITGYIPAVAEVEMGSRTIKLPFAISRWWDIAWLAMITASAALLFTSQLFSEVDECEKFVIKTLLKIELAVTLFGFIFFGLISGAIGGIIYGLIFGLLGGAALGLVVGAFSIIIICLGLIFQSSIPRKIANWLLAK